jgi:Ras-related GTP-binding protein C/D
MFNASFVFLRLYLFRLREDLEAAAFDNQSSSLIKLNNGTILYLREVNKFLALVCILREDNFDRQGKNNSFNIMCIKKSNISRSYFYSCFLFIGVIDYNFLCFRKAIQQVFELRNKALAATNANNHSSSPTSTNETSNAPTVSQTGTIGQNGTVVIAQS